MPAAAVRVQGARHQTRWTLQGDRQNGYRHEQLPPYSPQDDSDMQAHGGYYAAHEPSPGYDSYDGSGYGSALSSRDSSARYSNDAMAHHQSPSGPTLSNSVYSGFDFRESYNEPPQTKDQPVVNGVDGNHFAEFRFHPDDQVTTHEISLDTRIQKPSSDAIGQHLLYETALLDTQNYEILSMGEIDELKKEHVRLNQRLDGANRKLALETKVKNAAANLQRLYSSKKDARPDTPQSPESPRKQRSSLLGGRGRSGSGQPAQSLQQAEEELAQSIKRVDELQEQIKALLERRQTVERTLLQHTAAVLAEQANKPPEPTANGTPNGHRSFGPNELHFPEIDEFDGIRDILRGLPAPASKQEIQKATEEHAQHLVSMHNRLEQLNSQLRSIIAESSRTRGKDPAPEPRIELSPDPKDNIESTFTLLSSNVNALKQEREYNETHYAKVQDGARLIRNAVEAQLGSDSNKVPQTPADAVPSHQYQLEYLEESLLAVQKLMVQHHNEIEAASSASGAAAKGLEDSQAKSKRIDEYETVLAGLWDLMAAENLDTSSGEDEGTRSPRTTGLKQDFSIQAFNSRAQHVVNMANGARQQQDILRRQIQQQRDLNGKSDVESKAQFEEMQGKYSELVAAHDATQENLASYMVKHEQAEREASESRAEMQNVTSELEQFKQTIETTQARQREVEQRHAQISAERDEAATRHSEIQQEMEKLESEVVRLTTELTIAKADLEAAHGTRSERQKEAGMAEAEMDALNKLKDQEIADLKKGQDSQLDTLRKEHAERAKLLETELQDMANEFQEMTRESLEMEKERAQLESLIDGLRERCDTLESQLDDDKINGIGVKKPAGAQANQGPRDSTSITVLRTEFKKMMRESRLESIKLIRTEQEERRKLEGELRKVRQATSPFAKAAAARDALSAANAAQSKLNVPQTNGIVGANDSLSPASAAANSASG